jgi:hypothetical protein
VVGGWIGQGIGKWVAVGRAAASHDGARLIPLDRIASVQFMKSAGLSGWLSGQTLLVTTAGGAEYEFRGRMDGWQAALAGALTVRDHGAHVTPQGISVTPS